MQQTPRSAPKRDPAIARHRRHTAADAARPPPKTGSTPPARRETDPGLRRRSGRTRSPWRAVAVPGVSRACRAAARTADADWRRPAPCPTARPPPVRWSGRMPTQSDTPTAPSSRSQPRLSAQATGSRRGEPPRPSHPAARTRCPGRAGRNACPGQGRGFPSALPIVTDPQAADREVCSGNLVGDAQATRPTSATATRAPRAPATATPHA